MPKRFNNLKAALKTLGPPTADQTVADASPPPGSILDNFHKFYTGAKKVNYERGNDSKKIRIVPKVVRPFALPNDADGYIVGVSQRALNGLTTAGITESALELTEPAAGSLEKPGFLPARIIISVTGAATANADKVTSQITGIKYYAKPAVSYTFPFGQEKTGATPTYEGNMQSTLAASVTAGSTRQVNFKPEVW